MLILGKSHFSKSTLIHHIKFYQGDQHISEMASTYHELLAGHAAIRLFAYRYSIKSYSMIVVFTGELNV